MNSKFDNTYTLKYKKVVTLETPRKYIFYKDDSFYPLLSLIGEQIETPISELYKEYKGEFGLQEFLNMYFYVATESGVDEETALYNINQFIDDQNIELESKSKAMFNKYETVEDIKFSVRNWIKNYEKMYDEDVKIANNIVEIQQQLEELAPKNFEPVGNLPVKEEATYVFHPTIEIQTEQAYGRGKVQTVTNYIESSLIMFNEMKASETVPFIQLNYNGKKYFKIFEDEGLTNVNKLFEYLENDADNHFYFMVLNNGEFLSGKRNSYTKVTYNLKNNKLKYTCKPDIQKDTIRRGLQYECFKGFKFLTYKEVNINGQLMIRNFNIDETSFYFLVFNDPTNVISTYFFVDDSDQPYAEKPYLKIKYQDIYDEEPEESTTRNPSSMTVNLKNEDNNLIIDFTKAANEKILNQFKEIFGRVLTLYEDYYKSDIVKFLDDFVPKEETLEVEETKKKRKLVTEEIFESKINQLRYEAEGLTPGLFDKNKVGYTRRCDCKKQPIIISEEEADSWGDRVFNEKGQLIKRQVGEFPPYNAKFLYVCPTDEFPYPAVIENQNPESTKQYPYVPCCAESDNINNPNSKYNNYDKDKTAKININKSYKINTMKKLDYGKTGQLPGQIETLLNSNYTFEKKIEFERFGVGESYNALIHCIFKAINDKNYTTLSNYEDKENFCLEFRNKIEELLPNYLEIIKQETYNMDKEDILFDLIDDVESFDSSKYYRILEEIFNVNIFVFLPREGKSEEPIIEVPNHTLTHIRNFRPDRKTVLVLKHMGGELESLKYYQYDLIYSTGKLKNSKDVSVSGNIYMFDNQITELMYGILRDFNQNYIFNFQGLKVESRLYPLGRVNWLSIFKNHKLLSQNIDAYGKLRSVNVQIKNDKLTVYIPPFQPLNLPSSEQVYIGDYEMIKRVFGEPSAEISEGLWYSVIDFDYGVFIPCVTNSIETYPISPLPRPETENNPIKNFRESQKYSYVLLEFIKWGLRSNGVLNLIDFYENVDKYIVVDESTRSNVNPKKLISYITEKGNFTYLNQIWPEYFKGNKVHLYLKLYNKVIAYLEKYYIDTDGLSEPPNPYLNGIFEHEWDFRYINKNRILIGDSHINTWIHLHEKNYKNEIQIVTELNLSNIANMDKEEPFIYKDVNGNHMYLIQLVKDNLFSRALACGNLWNKNKINLGYNVNPNETNQNIPYVIYSISAAFGITIESDNDIKASQEDEFVSILRLGDELYASMMLLF